MPIAKRKIQRIFCSLRSSGQNRIKFATIMRENLVIPPQNTVTCPIERTLAVLFISWQHLFDATFVAFCQPFWVAFLVARPYCHWTTSNKILPYEIDREYNIWYMKNATSLFFSLNNCYITNWKCRLSNFQSPEFDLAGEEEQKNSERRIYCPALLRFEGHVAALGEAMEAFKMPAY